MRINNQAEFKMNGTCRYYLILWVIRFLYRYVSAILAGKLSKIMLKEIKGNFDKYIKVKLKEV